MQQSICRKDNWNQACEISINQQIKLEYLASIEYHMLANYFDRDNIALKKISKFFNKCSLEERDHANMFMEYQNKRGGVVNLGDINFGNIFHDSLGTDNKSDLLVAFEKALELEQTVYSHLLKLHKIADSSGDPQFTDFIEGIFLDEQINAINELSTYIAQIKRIGNSGHGQWNFDREFSSE
jgi:ferritin heavy chain